ncbi:plasma membrane ATPase 1 [Cucumis melo var. makuwa]|uniref:Plasma membrane ATPase 1 n=1 Tax=Cucumis melo var. makuwa TaxID=1194695 RepID=A0A5A7VFR2_CUCMM|nr:plasma membrane ATPase 1 [Cucumis melo var. makuwa]TYK15098.1 plasma membrane ATPase 1 [Cucumis melo var. makuwa]
MSNIRLQDSLEDYDSTLKRRSAEMNPSKKQFYDKKADEQPSTSVVDKGKALDIQETNKKKESVVRGKTQNNYTRPSLGKCFRCREPGHLSNNCLGSSENFVARKLVTILNLKTDPHSDLYKIGWVKKGGEALINEIYTVPLSIGNSYKDQIVCDVIEMDVCHLLLGRPWQHDTRTLHRGRENTYEFHWMGKTVILLPLAKKNT